MATHHLPLSYKTALCRIGVASKKHSNNLGKCGVILTRLCSVYTVKEHLSVDGTRLHCK